MMHCHCYRTTYRGNRSTFGKGHDMNRLTAAVVVTLASLIGGCGGAETSTTPGTPTPSLQSPSKKASTSAGGDGEEVLIGTVGEAEDPEAFTIALTDSSGKPVATLAAGEYQVKVTDLAKIHNFHLTGPGVDESTTVPSTGEVTWSVTLKPGSYTFTCDPHPEMVGNVEVT